MKYDFDRVIDRHNTYSIKWDGVELFKDQAGSQLVWNSDTIPMMVADMDFACPPALQAAMHRVADHGIYGYTLHTTEPRYLASIVDWYKRRYHTDLREEWIVYSDGSVTAINCAIETFTNPGDGVIIQRPVYGHFTGMIADDTHRRVVSNHLINKDGYYTIDWEDFERKCAVPVNRAFILCSPANPIGRVWTREELARMAEICRNYQVLLIADEIHSDIIHQGVSHRPILSATGDYGNIILVNGINKSFNVAGLHCSNVVIPDDNLRGIFTKQFGMRMPTPFGVAAVTSAYDESEDWLNELNLYLDANIDFTIGFLHAHMPQVKVWRPEGTYMLWLDFNGYGLSDEAVHNRIYKDANVMLQDGLVHDPEEGACFQRMCVALPRSVLETALKRIAAAFS
ncbi:MAG: pyridoxal phosphate-dependent aminotransferase [Treponema sp.]|jgi:cystathionine beta-lyase|nr:pyridoxal phosphate-dependent aminotransferase [Treponema sp.]